WIRYGRGRGEHAVPEGTPTANAMSRGIHPRILLVLYGALSALPLLAVVSDTEAWSDVPTARALGTGLLALAMLLLQFVSSGRYETLSRQAGIDRTMRFHQLAARAVVVLVVLHLLLLLVPHELAELPALPSAAARLFTAPHLASGVTAWL